MTTDRDGPRSNPYRQDPAQCCEACVFGSGKHAEWCRPLLNIENIRAALREWEKMIDSKGYPLQYGEYVTVDPNRFSDDDLPV